MQLSTNQKRELQTIAHLDGPVWPGFPPSEVNRELDPDFADYVDNGFVKWTGKGYRITAKGLRALNSKILSETRISKSSV